MTKKLGFIIGIVGLAVAVVTAISLGVSRKRPTFPMAKRLWLGPAGGCVEVLPHATVGTFACWSANQFGQLGDGTNTPVREANKIDPGTRKLTSLGLGPTHSCAVYDNHSVMCWGDGKKGQLVDGQKKESSFTAVRAFEDAKAAQAKEIQVAVGGAHSCARYGNEMHCWGADDSHQLGRDHGGGPLDGSDNWYRNGDIVSVALGDAHTCAAYANVKSETHAPSYVWCQGRATAVNDNDLLSAAPVTTLAAGGDHTCALLADGTVRCWGKNEASQLGDGTTNDSLEPVQIPNLSGVVGIALGYRHTCAHLNNGTVACWGANDRHQLANGTTERSSRPNVIVGLVGVRQLAAAGDGSCARLDDGFVRCWGANADGQLGNGSTEEQTVPMPIKYR